MNKLENLKIEEKAAIEKFRARMKNALNPKLYEDDLLFFRFLKARNFDMDKSEAMLRKHLLFRKVMQVDTLLEDFKPKEVFFKHIGRSILGTDKEGNIVLYFDLGRVVVADIAKCYKYHNFLKHLVWIIESTLAYFQELNLKTGGNGRKVTFIANVDKLDLVNIFHPITPKGLHFIAEQYQDNYPETLKAVFIINAPSYYIIPYAIFKRVLCEEIIQKFQIFGRNGWTKALLDAIDADVLPAFLGGDRTDPDGNPMCNTIVCHSGKVSEKYYLSKEERTFKDKSQVTQVTVYPRDTHQVYINVKEKESGSVLQWEFEVPKKDIGLGLFYKDSVDNLEEVIPISRFETLNGTEKDSYKCQRVGMYVVIFDNTYSWLNTKELSYCIKVVNP